MKKAGKGVSPVLKVVLLVLAAAAVWQCAVRFSASNREAETQGREVPSILREILCAYSREQDPSAERMETLWKELEDADRDQAVRWKEILNCWKKADNSMRLNYGSLPDGLENSGKLCLIVLGFQLNPDGSMQEELVGRLQTALKSAEKYPDSYILCTGGSTGSGNSGVTEAGAMAQWLTERGIAEDRILVENRALTTSQNAMFSYQILIRDCPEVTQAAIISSDYHIPWGTVLFQTQFLLGDHPLTLVSNAAYPTGRKIRDDCLLRWQQSGIMEIAGIP